MAIVTAFFVGVGVFVFVGTVATILLDRPKPMATRNK